MVPEEVNDSVSIKLWKIICMENRPEEALAHKSVQVFEHKGKGC